MIFKAEKTHLLPTILLLAAAVLPTSPLWTLGAYGDTETSSSNVFQAGVWGEIIEIEIEELGLLRLMLDEPAPEPTIEGGEVAGTSTDPIVEIGEPIVETTLDTDEEPADPLIEPEQPAEEPAPEPVVEEEEPVVEVAQPEPEPTIEEAPAEDPPAPVSEPVE